jgi:hypothetical protein
VDFNIVGKSVMVIVRVEEVSAGDDMLLGWAIKSRVSISSGRPTGGNGQHQNWLFSLPPRVLNNEGVMYHVPPSLTTTMMETD